MGLVALTAEAAPGPFTLSGGPICYVYSPAIFLQWTASSDAKAYKIFRDDGQPMPDSNPSHFVLDTSVVIGGPPHTYFVRATDAAGMTADSNSLTATPFTSQCSPPPEPFTITGKAFCQPGDPLHAMHAAIHLEWPSVEFASTFDVYRNGLYVYSGPALNGPSTNSYEELNQGTDDEAIEFRVVAKNGAGTSVSNSITLTAVASVCATSPPVAILSGTVACGTAANIPLVALQWTTVDGAAGWKIYRNGLPFAVAKFRDFVDTDVLLGRVYAYNVATNGLAAPLSDTLTIFVSDSICGGSVVPGRRRAASH